MRIVVIGGSGHIGSFLTPKLVEAGHHVINVSRRQRTPYRSHPAWAAVEQLTLDRAVEEAAGSFGIQIARRNPELVIDITCYTLESAKNLVECLHGHISHFLHCGTIWVHGASVEIPTTEDQPRHPIDDYGRRKAAIESFLLAEYTLNQFPATILHPGHLVGPGWNPLGPAANFNLQVFANLARGQEVLLPNLGRESVHHVHAQDVAAAFLNAIEHRSAAVGQSFHVVSPKALTLLGYANAVANWFGKEPSLTFLPWEEWKETVNRKDAQVTWGHIARSSCCSIEKARRLLNYTPQYSSLEAVRESVFALVDSNALSI